MFADAHRFGRVHAEPRPQKLLNRTMIAKDLLEGGREILGRRLEERSTGLAAQSRELPMFVLEPDAASRVLEEDLLEIDYLVRQREIIDDGVPWDAQTSQHQRCSNAGAILSRRA